MAQRLKCLPAMQDTWVRSLGLEDPLEKEMTIHSSILAWRIFKFYVEYIMRNAGQDDAQAGIKIVREISLTLNMQMIPPL